MPSAPAAAAVRAVVLLAALGPAVQATAGEPPRARRSEFGRRRPRPRTGSPCCSRVEPGRRRGAAACPALRVRPPTAASPRGLALLQPRGATRMGREMALWGGWIGPAREQKREAADWERMERKHGSREGIGCGETVRRLVLGFHPSDGFVSLRAEANGERRKPNSSRPLICGPRAHRGPPVIDPSRQPESEKNNYASDGCGENRRGKKLMYRFWQPIEWTRIEARGNRGQRAGRLGAFIRVMFHFFDLLMDDHFYQRQNITLC